MRRLLEIFNPTITIALNVLTVIGIAFIISIPPKSIFWAVIILLSGSFIYLGRHSC
jgi:hypothetical protein